MKVAYEPTVIYLRTHPSLKHRLQDAARENQRTLNAEIVWRLQRSLDGYRR